MKLQLPFKNLFVRDWKTEVRYYRQKRNKFFCRPTSMEGIGG